MKIDIDSHLSPAVRDALDRLDLPVDVLDVRARPAWENLAARAALEHAAFDVRSAPLHESGAVIGTLRVRVPVTGRVRAATPDSTGGLTPRQLEVLRLLGQGLDTRQIAVRLHLAEETVRNHVRAVLGRLGVHSRLGAVVAAARLGLLDDLRG